MFAGTGGPAIIIIDTYSATDQSRLRLRGFRFTSEYPPPIIRLYTYLPSLTLPQTGSGQAGNRRGNNYCGNGASGVVLLNCFNEVQCSQIIPKVIYTIVWVAFVFLTNLILLKIS